MFRRSLQAARRTQDHAKSKVFKGSIMMFSMVMRVIRMMVMMTVVEFFEILLIDPGHHPCASKCSLIFEDLEIVGFSLLIFCF